MSKERMWKGLVSAACLMAACCMSACKDNSSAAGGGTPSAPHELKVGETAPDFTLLEVHDAGKPEKLTLSQLIDQRPVVVVFYLNYSCERCVTHLKEMAELQPEFEKAGLQVVAISPDEPATTRDSLKAFGDIGMPLLFDEGGKVSKAYGLVDAEGKPMHGTFLVAKNRNIKLLERGDHPFTGYGALLAVGRSVQAFSNRTGH